MSNHRTKSNDTLRKKIKGFLKTKHSGETFHINSAITKISKLNKNYNINAPRLVNLFRELDNIVCHVGNGIWTKL